MYTGFGGIVRCAKKSGWTGIPADILFGAYATWWHFSVDVELGVDIGGARLLLTYDNS